MKTRVRHLAFFVLIGLFLCLPIAGLASPPPADSLHFCAFDDYERWRRDHPRSAAKRLADLNVGEPRTVRLIFFLPIDRPFRSDAIRLIKDEIRKAQAFFGEQMQAHGYGNLTFRIETDAHGEPMVHRVEGQHPESHYFETTPGMLNAFHYKEIEQEFDFDKNVYVIYKDISEHLGPATGYRRTKNGATVNLPGTFERSHWKILSHELAHAFGLPHDYRDGAYILSYGGPTQFPGGKVWDRISACTAEFLSGHPYFNSAIPIEESSPPTIELISPSKYPGGSKSVSIEFELSDAEGLHQVLLYTNPAYGYGGLRECRALEGRRDAVVEFEYEGSSMAADPERAITSLSDSLHLVEVRVVDTDGNMIKLRFDLVADHVTDALKGHTDSVNAVAFSPDSTTLASGSSDGTVKLWDVARRELLATLEGHSYPVMAVAFSRDGSLASGSWNDGVKLWDVTTRKETATLEGIAPLAFSRDGSVLASGSDNRRITLWDVRTLEKIATFEGHTEQINTVAFSPDGTLLASGSGHLGSEDQTVRLWDLEKREEVATIEHTGAIWSVAFAPDGALLASAVGSPDNQVRLWDVRTRREVTRLWHSGPVLSVAFSRGASIFASGFTSNRGDGKVRLYDLQTLEFIGAFLPFRPRSGGVRSLAISHDETTLAAGTAYHTIELRDVSEWKRPPFPFGLETISGEGQQGTPGTPLSRPLIVEVRDQYGDLLPDAVATFTVTAGEGRLSGRFTVEHATTDADGRAELTLTLGPQPGPNIVGVSLGGRELATFIAQGDGTAVAELEGNYRTWHLPAAATARLGKGRLGEGDRAVALSQDGRCLAVASAIGVWLYEASTSRALALLPTEGAVHSVAFSLDGVLASGLDNGRVELWDVETGTSIGTLRHGGRVTAVVFSPDGTSLASGSWDQVIKLWDVETRREVGTWDVPREGSSAYSISVAFSRDGMRLVSGFQDGSIRLWDVTSRAEVAALEGHRDRVTSVTFSPDGSRLASAGGWNDPTVRLWDVETQTEVATLRGHMGEVRSVSFSSPDGATLASGSSDRTVKLWDVATQEEVVSFEEHRDGIRSVTFSPDGATLVSGADDGTVLLRDVETGNAAGLDGHRFLSSMALSPDGTLLASGSQAGTVRLWDAETQAQISRLGGHTGRVHSMAFSPDGATLASGSWDRTVKLWEVGTRALVGTLEGHTGRFHSMAFSPDGATLAYGSLDRTVRLLDVATQELIGTLVGHTDVVQAVAFSPDGALLASASGWNDARVSLWDVSARELVGTLKGHTNLITSVTFTRGGTALASGSRDRTVRLWDLATRTSIATLENRSPVNSVAFSSDGAMLVTGTRHSVRLWDVETREQIGEMQGHTGSVHSVAFSHDGTTLASGSDDGTILLWDLQRLQSRPHTLRPVSGLEHQGSAGATLANPFVVLVVDQNGDPVVGATVTFTVTVGGGTLSVGTATTDENGRAATTLTLGSQPGTNTVVATVKDLEPVAFTATARAPSDFDGDGTVGFGDFVQFAAQFGLSQVDEGYDARYDLDGNGAIGFGDFVIFAQAFGENISSS